MSICITTTTKPARYTIAPKLPATPWPKPGLFILRHTAFYSPYLSVPLLFYSSNLFYSATPLYFFSFHYFISLYNNILIISHRKAAVLITKIINRPTLMRKRAGMIIKIEPPATQCSFRHFYALLTYRQHLFENAPVLSQYAVHLSDNSCAPVAVKLFVVI